MVEKVLKLFEEKPYTLRMGSKLISKLFKLPLKDIVNARNLLKLKKKNYNLKILFVDIETSPMRAFVWSRWKQNIYLELTISEWFMICWSAKWINNKEVLHGVCTSEEVINEDDKRITKELWYLLDLADVVVAHNGKKFDVPKMNSRFIIHGLPPTSPYKLIDTKEISAKQFGFSSNKLDALATYFKIPNKDETNFDLWVECLKGNKKALNYMSKYCDKDVLILEQVYFKLRPWIKNHPNVGLFIDSDTPICSHCGSTNLINNSKYVYTSTSKFGTIRCLDCGALSRTKCNKNKNKNLIISV